MEFKVILVDVNPNMVRAWRRAFGENAAVEVVHGSMLAQTASAWVSPTNSQGKMDGGLDAAVRGHLGGGIQARVRREIAREFGGFMPLGYATCVPTGRGLPQYLISTPTMFASAEDVSETMNVALACCAAFQAAAMQNRRAPGSIRSVALPGLGAGTGRVSVDVCADLMWTAYNLFCEQEFDTFASMRAALEAELGDLGHAAGVGGQAPYPVAGAGPYRSTAWAGGGV